MRIARLMFVGAIGCALAATSLAQQPPAQPSQIAIPDIIGIKLGSAFAAAADFLEKEYRGHRFSVFETELFDGTEENFVQTVRIRPNLASNDGRRHHPHPPDLLDRLYGWPVPAYEGTIEGIEIVFSPAAEEKDRLVIAMTRNIAYGVADQVSVAALAAGLREKYGAMPTVDTGRYFVWAAARGGQPIARSASGRVNPPCDLGTRGAGRLTNNTSNSDCGSFVEAQIWATAENPAVAVGLSVTAFSPALQTAARNWSQRMAREATERRQREELERVNQRAPGRL